MKRSLYYYTFLTMVFSILFVCGGCGSSGGGSGGGTGTLSLDITDAKPMVPGNPTEVWITFEEVLAHESGGSWVSLPLPDTPFRINLLAFHDGATTQLVSPAELDSGNYTQLRFVISQAYMIVGGVAHEIDLDVPSGFLRTDKQFTFFVGDGGAVNIIVHFDLSRSIVATGSSNYKLKPVLHIFDDTREAATICGRIEPLAPGDPPQDVIVTVIRDANDEIYTQATVTRESDTEPEAFCIFWLVPNEDYTMEIDQDGAAPPEFDEQVSGADLGPGDTFELNGGLDIPI